MGGADHEIGPQVDEHRHLGERCVMPRLRLQSHELALLIDVIPRVVELSITASTRCLTSFPSDIGRPRAMVTSPVLKTAMSAFLNDTRREGRGAGI